MDNDKALYKEFLNGNEESFNKIVEKYKNNLIFFITRYVKNVEIAEDIFQDVIVYILEHKESYNTNYSLKTYLYTIAKSKALNYLNKSNKTVQLDESLKDEDLLEEIICSKEGKDKIHKVIDKLPKDYQIVIYLGKIEGLSNMEIASIMNKTEKQVKDLLYNAKKKLKKLLIQEKVVEIKNNKVIKLLSIILVVGIVTSGVVYAGVVIYKNYIWKEPEQYNWSEEKEVTEEEKSKALSEEEAKNMTSELAISLNITLGTITKCELIKYPDREEMQWMIVYDNDISFTIDANTGKLKQFSDWSINDTKIPSTTNKEEATNIANELYKNLGYKEGEYKIKSISQNAISDGTNLWGVDFCKEYDGIYNDYQCVRITFIPEIKKVVILTLFDYPFENNEIIISKDEAEQIAKKKAKELGKDENKIEKIETILDIKMMNSFVYSTEKYQESNNQNISENTTQNVKVNDYVSYRTENLIRKVWVVRITNKNDVFADKQEYFVDCTTGEIIGGDGTK